MKLHKLINQYTRSQSISVSWQHPYDILNQVSEGKQQTARTTVKDYNWNGKGHELEWGEYTQLVSEGSISRILLYPFLLFCTTIEYDVEIWKHSMIYILQHRAVDYISSITRFNSVAGCGRKNYRTTRMVVSISELLKYAYSYGKGIQKKCGDVSGDFLHSMKQNCSVSYPKLMHTSHNIPIY